jgi:hypothetical protein
MYPVKLRNRNRVGRLLRMLATTLGDFCSDFCIAPDDYTGDGIADSRLARHDLAQ